MRFSVLLLELEFREFGFLAVVSAFDLSPLLYKLLENHLLAGFLFVFYIFFLNEGENVILKLLITMSMIRRTSVN